MQHSRIINRVLCSSGNGVAGRYSDVCLSFQSPRASQGIHEASAGCQEGPKRNKGNLMKVWGGEGKPLLKRRFRTSHPLYLGNSYFSPAQLLAKTCHIQIQLLKGPLPKCMAAIKPPWDAISFHIYRWCFNCCLNDIYLFIKSTHVFTQVR